MTDSIVIVAARRTPIGAFQGVFAPVTAPQLGATAARAALADAGLAPDAIDEVIFGCVLPAGLGQAPARQAAVGAGIALGVPATTVNKMCGSGMKAVMMAADQIRAGSARVMLAGGLESMTNAPYLLLKARGGYRMGHAEIFDHMFYDGLQSPWDGKAMGCFADATVGEVRLHAAPTRMRSPPSPCAARSGASKAGDFVAEIAPVTVKTRKGEQVVATTRRRSARHREDPDAEAGVRQGRHGDGRVLVVDLGRRGRAGAGERVGGQGRGAQAARAPRRLCQPRAGAGVVHDRARAVDAEGARPRRLEGQRRRPVRDQRGVRLRRDGRDAATSASPTTRSTSTAAPARSATRSARPARASSPRCCYALRKRGLRRGVASQCIGGGEACAVAIELL